MDALAVLGQLAGEGVIPRIASPRLGQHNRALRRHVPGQAEHQLSQDRRPILVRAAHPLEQLGDTAVVLLE